MFIVFLKFSANRHQAKAFMQEHKEWLQRGFDDRVFFLAGSLPPGQGGVILAHGVTHTDLGLRLNEDPFVREGVVGVEVVEVEPNKVDEHLAFLLG